MNFWRPGIIPASHLPSSTVFKWADALGGSDTERKYHRKPHPFYGPDDITYSINSLGYRSMEIDLNSPRPKIAFIGCSFTLGDGLPYQDVWTSHTVRMLSDHLGREVEQHNFGLCGHGNDYMAMMAFQILPVLKPDFLVVFFTELTRKSYFPDFDRREHYTIHMVNKPGYGEYARHAYDADGFYNWVRDFQLIDFVAKAAGVPWAWGAMHRYPDQYGEYVRTDNKLDYFPVFDTARDNLHPGPQSNKAFADKVVDYLLRTDTNFR